MNKLTPMSQRKRGRPPLSPKEKEQRRLQRLRAKEEQSQKDEQDEKVKQYMEFHQVSKTDARALIKIDEMIIETTARPSQPARPSEQQPQGSNAPPRKCPSNESKILGPMGSGKTWQIPPYDPQENAEAKRALEAKRRIFELLYWHSEGNYGRQPTPGEHSLLKKTFDELTRIYASLEREERIQHFQMCRAEARAKWPSSFWDPLETMTKSADKKSNLKLHGAGLNMSSQLRQWANSEELGDDQQVEFSPDSKSNSPNRLQGQCAQNSPRRSASPAKEEPTPSRASQESLEALEFSPHMMMSQTETLEADLLARSSAAYSRVRDELQPKITKLMKQQREQDEQFTAQVSSLEQAFINEQYEENKRHEADLKLALESKDQGHITLAKEALAVNEKSRKSKLHEFQALIKEKTNHHGFSTYTDYIKAISSQIQDNVISNRQFSQAEFRMMQIENKDLKVNPETNLRPLRYPFMKKVFPTDAELSHTNRIRKQCLPEDQRLPRFASSQPCLGLLSASASSPLVAEQGSRGGLSLDPITGDSIDLISKVYDMARSVQTSRQDTLVNSMAIGKIIQKDLQLDLEAKKEIVEPLFETSRTLLEGFKEIQNLKDELRSEKDSKRPHSDMPHQPQVPFDEDNPFDDPSQLLPPDREAESSPAKMRKRKKEESERKKKRKRHKKDRHSEKHKSTSPDESPTSPKKKRRSKRETKEAIANQVAEPDSARQELEAYSTTAVHAVQIELEAMEDSDYPMLDPSQPLLNPTQKLAGKASAPSLLNSPEAFPESELSKRQKVPLVEQSDAVIAEQEPKIIELPDHMTEEQANFSEVEAVIVDQSPHYQIQEDHGRPQGQEEGLPSFPGGNPNRRSSKRKGSGRRASSRKRTSSFRKTQRSRPSYYEAPAQQQQQTAAQPQTVAQGASQGLAHVGAQHTQMASPQSMVYSINSEDPAKKEMEAQADNFSVSQALDDLLAQGASLQDLANSAGQLNSTYAPLQQRQSQTHPPQGIDEQKISPIDLTSPIGQALNQLPSDLPDKNKNLSDPRYQN